MCEICKFILFNKLGRIFHFPTKAMSLSEYDVKVDILNQFPCYNSDGLSNTEHVLNLCDSKKALFDSKAPE